jgi:hypothetical protein
MHTTYAPITVKNIRASSSSLYLCSSGFDSPSMPRTSSSTLKLHLPPKLQNPQHRFTHCTGIQHRNPTPGTKSSKSWNLILQIATDRAPTSRWSAASLQEMKHMPLYPSKRTQFAPLSLSLAKTSLTDEPRTDPSIHPSIHPSTNPCIHSLYPVIHHHHLLRKRVLGQ